MIRRVVLALVVLTFLTGCDSYVERVEVGSDGSARLQVRAEVVCDDALQQEIWGQSPCDALTEFEAGGDPGARFGITLAPTSIASLGPGRVPRQVIDLGWEGEVSQLNSGLVASAELRRLDDGGTEFVVRPGGAPIPSNLAQPEVRRKISAARWREAELQVVAPEVVTGHNGDEINGRTVVWRIDGDQPDELFVQWTGEDPPRQFWWWLLISVVFSVVFIMILMLEGSRGREDDRRQVRRGDGPGRDGG